MPAFFYAYAQKALRAGATTIADGRLQSSVPVEIAEVESPATTRSIPARYALFGPGDVLRLGAGAISRRFPAPGVSDAEYEKCAHVEFTAQDLPWRYTPHAAAGSMLRPWLVLVVGRQMPEEIVPRPDGRVGIGPTAQLAHPLSASHQWAHLHQVGDRCFARLLSPLQLEKESDYVACLVPAFAADGTDMWNGAAPVVLDCYDWWTFRTSPLGDFPDLAEKLHKADLAAIDAAAGKPFGRAQVGYTWRGTSVQPPAVLSTAGALRLPPGSDADPADAPPDPAVVAEVVHLTDRILTPDGRRVVTAPRYDAPFVTAATQAGYPAGGWIDQLRGDPRARGAAGLGAWNAIEWQDRIADAAATKAADLAVAQDRIRHVALGVEASRSIWRRRVPALPADIDADPDASLQAASRLLDVLGPALGRLPADGGGTVLDAVAGRTPRLARALFSSAARRALRPGPARTARAQEGAGSLPAALRTANHCIKRSDDPADVRADTDVSLERLEEVTKLALLAVAPADEELVDKVLDRMFANGRRPSTGEIAAALHALAPGKDGHADPKSVERFLDSDEHPDPALQITGWPDWLEETASGEPCEPINLVGLAQAVAAAIDPSVAVPPAAQRVLATLPGITHIGPVEIEPELDLPLWSFLSRSAADWMLPGAGDLTDGDVVALATNPPFVQALLAGANTQTTAELRWRNLPMVTRWSPLRKFWQRTGAELDINPIKEWPDAKALGDPALAYLGVGAEAVVAFKTPLFRRYPATVVYLYEAAAHWVPPAENEVLDAPRRKDYTFTGTIGDDITFFGFPVAPADLAMHWVVLEEPPAGFRFYHDNNLGLPDVTSADYAHNRFAVPVRVLIGPLL
jgi:hypothetical protein